MAWYNKYRPLTFKDTIGQELVKKVLQNTIKTIFSDRPRVKHAYLFSGPRGTGKTSLARIFAKTLNCEDQEWLHEHAEPCGKCNTCLNGQIDIIELDAASNTGIDNVRELIEAANTPPFISRYKVYIIDEVHMLSKPAMNALLKTLEEPPSYVIFLMATTDPEKIIPTVMSRVTELRLTNHTAENLFGVISDISKKENLNLEPAAITLIAKQARGGLRDAINLLETLANYNLDNYDHHTVSDILGIMPNESLDLLIKSLLTGDSQNLKARVSELQDRGIDPQGLLAQLLDYLVDKAFNQYLENGEINSLHELSPLIQATEKVLTATYSLTSIQTALILLKIELGNQPGISNTSQPNIYGSGGGGENRDDHQKKIKHEAKESKIDHSEPQQDSKSTTNDSQNSSLNVGNHTDQIVDFEKIKPVLNTLDPSMFDETVKIPLISDIAQSIIKDSSIQDPNTNSILNTQNRQDYTDSQFVNSNFIALIHANLDIKHGPVILKTFWDNLVSYESDSDEILIHITNKTFLPPLKSTKTLNWLNQLAHDCYGKEMKIIVTDTLDRFNIKEISLPIQIKVQTANDSNVVNESNFNNGSPNFSLNQNNITDNTSNSENNILNVNNLEISSSISIKSPNSNTSNIQNQVNSEISTEEKSSASTVKEEDEFIVSDFYYLYSTLPDGTIPKGMKLYQPRGVASTDAEVSDSRNINKDEGSTSPVISADFERWKSELDDLELE